MYRNICRSLFEKHKLLFSLQMCVKILQRASKINLEEYQFFLRGGGLVDKSVQAPNPAPEWIPDAAWDNLTEMDARLANMRNISSAFEQNTQVNPNLETPKPNPEALHP